MTNAWSDFNDAKQASNVIPKGTIAKVRMTLRPGGFDDPSQGWMRSVAQPDPFISTLNIRFLKALTPSARSGRWSAFTAPKDLIGPIWAVASSAAFLIQRVVSPTKTIRLKHKMHVVFRASQISTGSNSWRASMSVPIRMVMKRTTSASR